MWIQGPDDWELAGLLAAIHGLRRHVLLLFVRHFPAPAEVLGAKPTFFNYFSGPLGLYNSGIIWYPNGHLQANLVYGPFIFSLVLATLFSLNMVLVVFSLRFSRFSRRTGPVGLLALVPALFSGGCCSVPIGLVGRYIRPGCGPLYARVRLLVPDQPGFRYSDGTRASICRQEGGQDE